MKPSKTIKYKALFLLVTFSLNSVVGFACSLGIDMGFNSHHHEHEEEGHQKHAHSHHGGSHGNNHHHSGHTHKHSHVEGHEQAAAGGSNAVTFRAADNDHCCSTFVVGFQHLDKQVVQKSNPAKPKSLLYSIILSNTIIYNNVLFIKNIRIPPKIPLDHSPPYNIRIFIQSFLI